MENTVFLQLYRNRTPVDQIYYYHGRGKCDFVVQHGTEVSTLFQVTWSMKDDETRKREIAGLTEAYKATGCKNLYIITYDETEDIEIEDGVVAHIVPAWQWLLGRR